MSELPFQVFCLVEPKYPGYFKVWYNQIIILEASRLDK